MFCRRRLEHNRPGDVALTEQTGGRETRKESKNLVEQLLSNDSG